MTPDDLAAIIDAIQSGAGDLSLDARLQFIAHLRRLRVEHPELFVEGDSR